MIKLKSLLNESYHPEMQKFAETLELLDKAGVINAEFFNSLRNKLDDSIRDLLDKADVDKKDKILYQKHVDKMVAPIKRMRNAKELIAYTKKLASQQRLDESIISEINFSAILQKIKKAIKGIGADIKAWWDQYGYDYMVMIAEFLAEVVVRLLIAFISGGKGGSGRKFGGGSFGGGGAGGKW